MPNAENWSSYISNMCVILYSTSQLSSELKFKHQCW